MGNYYSIPKEKWVKESLSSIKHKFGVDYIKDSEDKIISWEVIEYYLGILYDQKYKSIKLDPTELATLRYNPEDLDVFI